jgi:DTW domain-containing protein
VPLWIVRHVGEHRKTTNTARLAHRALSNSSLLSYGDQHYPFDPKLLPSSGYLLFPPALDHTGQPAPDGPPVHDLSQGPVECDNLVILDGTWAQARRMSHRLSPLNRWPRLIFSQVSPRVRVRRPPTADTMATLEAIGYAYTYLEGEEVGLQLLQVYDHFVEAYRKQCPKPLPPSP